MNKYTVEVSVTRIGKVERKKISQVSGLVKKKKACNSKISGIEGKYFLLLIVIHLR